MADTWRTLYQDVIEGRSVKLQIYVDGHLKVITTQVNTEASGGYVDGDTKVFPKLVSSGETIEIEAENTEKLYADLIKNDFSEEAAKEIIEKLSL